MSTILQDCPICKKPFNYDRRKTINIHTDISMCLECDKDYCQAQDNYRKWRLPIGRDM